MTKLSREAGMEEQEKRFGAWAKRLRKALGALQRKDGLVSDGLTTAGKLVKETSVHAQTLALLADFQPEQNARRLEKVLLPYIRGESNPKAVPDSYWINCVFEALTAAGHGTEVIRCIRKKCACRIGNSGAFEGSTPGRFKRGHPVCEKAGWLWSLVGRSIGIPGKRV